jgi:hypothetical protein
MTTRADWRRVSRAHPCPICERPDWCLVSVDGRAAICPRVESQKRVGEAGWLHRLKDDPDPQLRHHVGVVRLLDVGARGVNLARLVAQHRLDLDHGRLYQLAVSLGLSVASLCHFGIGWSVEHRAWSFPMTDGDGNVLGIRLRRPNGYKFAVTGSKEGLFIPSTVDEDTSSPLMVPEGPTDAAALLDMGYWNVVGRPSCTGGIKLLVELVRRRQPREVVIVSDSDEPGRRGADHLASVLVAYAPAVRVIAPPEGVKDARDWLRAGGSRRDLDEAIRAAAVRRLVIRAGATGAQKA